MNSKITQKFSFVFSLLWLMSLFIGFLFLNNSQNIESDNLVYCPLQKTWVKRNQESLPVSSNPLDQICMSEQKKQELLIQISLKKAFVINETGIFETLQKGIKVLDKYQETRDLPNQNLVQIRQSFSIFNSTNDLKQTFVSKTQPFSFALNSRPPTIQEAVNLNFQIAKSLEKISRNINPRSPPFSI